MHEISACDGTAGGSLELGKDLHCGDSASKDEKEIEIHLAGTLGEEYACCDVGSCDQHGSGFSFCREHS